MSLLELRHTTGRNSPGGRLESVWSTVDGLRMHARVATAAAPAGAKAVVLVHGLGVSSRYMIPTAEQLAPHYRVYAPDLPGFGRSDRPPHLLDIRGLANALAAWLRQAGPGRAALLGNSLGCQVIVDLAVRRPELVERAVLVGPTLDPEARSLWRQIARGVLDVFREPLSLWPIVAYDYLTAGPVYILRTLQRAVEDPVADKLPCVRVPALVIRGSRDPIVPQRWAEAMIRRLPAGRLVVLEGVAHAANYSAPVELARVVRPFLDEAP